LALLGVGGLGFLAITSPYRLARLTTFLNPWEDPFNDGFQLTQSLIAIGRGGLWGVGLGESVLKLSYLPEPHTDFIFAVLAEELGLLGMMGLVLLFGFLLYKMLRIGVLAEKQEKWFAAYLIYGIALLFGLGALLNMGVAMGLLPTKGLALPFISYGGSSLVANSLAFGLVLRVNYEVRRSEVQARKVRRR
jgi:cell division protein FtsW